MSTSVVIAINDPRWRKARLSTAIRRAVGTVLTGEGQHGGLTVLLTDATALHQLNRDFRGKDKPTNVLSFAPGPGLKGYLGDIAIAYDVAADEAEAAGKSFAHHVLHLSVHGTLHLLGYDHEDEREAALMEAKETLILQGLGVPAPYEQAS
ncbi:MAG: rRNA maturation RNase YbeY [Rhizomicrobium sp.]